MISSDLIWCRWTCVKLIFFFSPSFFSLCNKWQAKWSCHPYQDPEHRWLLWPVWRREVCHLGWVSSVLHGTPWTAQREEWWCYRVEVSTQLCWSNIWKVRETSSNRKNMASIHFATCSHNYCSNRSRRLMWVSVAVPQFVSSSSTFSAASCKIR